MYKLVAIDLDGTLLNSYGAVSERNKQAIQKAIERGVEIVLTSGRPMASVQNLANDLNANNYMICGNGSIVYDLPKKQVIYDKFIEKEKVLQIMRICEENTIYYNIYTENGIYAKNLQYNVLFYNQENVRKPESKKTNITLIQDLYSYIEKSNINNFLKITICDNNEIIFGSIIKRLRQIRNVDVLDVAHMSRKIIKSGTEYIPVEYYYTEITNKNVHKWDAICHLIEYLGIKPEEVMAIGDNVNDKTMLENAGLGVLMGNSASHQKELGGDVVVADNNSDGVAQAIEKYILEKE